MTAALEPRALFRRLLGFATRPLTLSQAFSSASGALALVVAASLLAPRQFSTFTLLLLVSNTLVGFGRAGVFQPALIQQRHVATSFVKGTTCLGLAVLSAAITVSSSRWLGVDVGFELTLLAAAAMSATAYDWMRFRAIALGHRWVVAGTDAVKLVLVSMAWVLPGVAHNAGTLQAYVVGSAFLPLLILVVTVPRPPGFAHYRDYASAAAWQLGDYVVGQFVLTVPLLVVGIHTVDDTISGIRLAQGLLGPLNLLFAAGVSNLVADAVTQETLRTPQSLIAAGQRLGYTLVGVAVAVVGTSIPLVLIVDPNLRGVSSEALVFGLSLVGGYALFSGWAGVQAMLMRLLDHQAYATIGRIIVASVTIVSFAVGYAVDGARGSMVGGFGLAAITFPIVFGVLARRVFRQIPE